MIEMLPKVLEKKNQKGTAYKALFVTGLALTLSLVLSFILPGQIYEYITTAAGVLLILNWVTILTSQIKLRKAANEKIRTYKMPGSPYTSYLGIAFILIAVSGGLFHPTQRMGVLISLGLIGVIFLSYHLIIKKRKPLTENY